MRLEIDIDDKLGSDYAELARVLEFDLRKLVEKTVGDALRNKLNDLRDEFKDP
jgi:hypothetical protein